MTHTSKPTSNNIPMIPPHRTPTRKYKTRIIPVKKSTWIGFRTYQCEIYPNSLIYSTILHIFLYSKQTQVNHLPHRPIEFIHSSVEDYEVSLEDSNGIIEFPLLNYRIKQLMSNKQFTSFATASPKSKPSSPYKNKSPKHQSHNENQSLPSSPSPIKFLLQNNINLNAGKDGERTPQEIEIITHLIKESSIFSELGIDLSDSVLSKELCNGIVLIYCQSPHIMQIKDNELYLFFEGQGFEYMQNNYGTEQSKKYRLYDNNEYIMLRKIVTNEYFLSMQEHNVRYHLSQKKYQLMVDQNTLIGKFSEEVFYKVFFNRILERQKNIIAVLKKVQIFSGLPNSFFQQFSKFVSEQRRKAGEKILSREDKSKFVYFVKSGNAEIRYFNQHPANTTPNYYISNYRPYTLISISKHDSFGMESPDQSPTEIEKEVICSEDCAFLKIDKRLLAIIITSFDLQFQQKNKLWSEVNINNQIKGQNYCSPEKELLLKNVERIRTSQRKIRDIKLKYLSSSKSKKDPASSPLPKQDNLKEIIKEVKEVKEVQEIIQKKQIAASPDQKRRMIKTTQGRFRSTKSIFKFINNFGGLDQEKKYNAIRKKLDEEREGQSIDRVNQIELLALDTNENKPSQKLLYSKAFDYKDKLEHKKMSRSTSKIQRYEVSNKFVPKLQVRSSFINSGSKGDSEMIGVFLDKKIKNQILKKAERVLSINKNVKLTENKNLRRLFAPSTARNINAISEFDKRSIADDIVQKMSNLRENPLLLQIQSERRKLQRQMKLSLRKAKANESPPPNKKYKKEDQFILIKNNQQ